MDYVVNVVYVVRGMAVTDVDLVEIARQAMKRESDFGVQTLDGRKVASVLWKTPLAVISRLIAGDTCTLGGRPGRSSCRDLRAQ